MPYIEFEGQARALGPGVLTIGSAPEAGWRIRGRGLEPLHAVIALETGMRAMLMQGAVEAAISINGAGLDGGRMLLSFGDTVRLGTAEIRYRQFPPGSAAPAGAYVRDTRRGRVHLLRERTTIGRDLANAVVIQEPDISRVHVEIVQHDNAYLIVPHHASVTSVNGVRLLAPAPLQEGDDIAIGNTVLRFTAALPSGVTVTNALAGSHPGHGGRESRAKTMFVGRIEAYEQRSRLARRKMNRMIAATIVALAVAGVVATMYTGARTNSRRVEWSHAHH